MALRSESRIMVDSSGGSYVCCGEAGCCGLEIISRLPDMVGCRPGSCRPNFPFSTDKNLGQRYVSLCFHVIVGLSNLDHLRTEFMSQLNGLPSVDHTMSDHVPSLEEGMTSKD